MRSFWRRTGSSIDRCSSSRVKRGTKNTLLLIASGKPRNCAQSPMKSARIVIATYTGRSGHAAAVSSSFTNAVASRACAAGSPVDA